MDATARVWIPCVKLVYGIAKALGAGAKDTSV